MSRPGPLPLPRRAYACVRRFLRDARAGATGITAAAVTVMTVGGAALVGDHVWLVDQRDVLKSAADAATVAATIEMRRLRASRPQITDAALEAALEPIARRYVLLNFGHLPEDRFERARDTLVVEVFPDQVRGKVDVTAEADLGGTLFARRLPLLDGFTEAETVRVEAEVECASKTVEVVLAFDVSRSMALRFGSAPRRIDAVMDAARALVDGLYSGCADAHVAVGIVPWDRTVKLPSHQDWARNGWATLYTYQRASVPATDWAGCIEDRGHDNPPEHSPGLSLKHPGDAPFPAYMYPDTTTLPPALVRSVSDYIEPWLFGQFSAWSRTGLDRSAIEAFVAGTGDNRWGEPLPDFKHPRAMGGPNAYCTHEAILPLTGDRDAVRAKLSALSALADDELWVGMTLHHVGAVWGRRLLASDWRDVWGGGTHPLPNDPDEVVKAMVLLTDGAVEAGDRGQSLPGRLIFRHLEPQPPGQPLARLQAKQAACTWWEFNCTRVPDHASSYASGYSAVGRLGAGIPHDEGGDRVPWGHDRNDARDRLTWLAHDACRLVRDDGVAIYGISVAASGDPEAQDLIATCAGTHETVTSEQRAPYIFSADDPAALEAAFQEIAQRLLTVRRVR